jgi:hypothetical protein
MMAVPSIVFGDVSFGSWLCENALAEALTLYHWSIEFPVRAVLQRELAGGDYALIAAMSG